MLKGFNIVIRLTLVVVLSSLAVWYVEGETTWRIEEYQRELIQEAVKEVFPAIEGTTWTVEDSDMDFGDSPITGAQEIIDENGNLQGIVYSVVFRGFSSNITYVVGVDPSGQITGYSTIEQGDTAGYGAQIADEENWTQFAGMYLDAAGSGAFDGLSGATVTTTGWKNSFAGVATWHNDNEVFPPIPQITIDQALVQSKLGNENLVLEELTSSQLELLAELGIDTAYKATDGTSSYIVYIETFDAYNPGTKVFLAVDATTHETVKFEVLESNDTEEYGYQIMGADWTQLEDTTLYTLVGGDFDGVSGATKTTGFWKDAMARIAKYHQETFQGIITYTTAELIPEYEQQLTTISLGEFTAWNLNAIEGIKYSTSVTENGYAISYEYPDSGNGMDTLSLSQNGYNFVSGSTYRVLIEGTFNSERYLKVVIGSGDDAVELNFTINEDSTATSQTFTAETDFTNVTMALQFGKYTTDIKDGTFSIKSIKVEEKVNNVAVDGSDQVVNGTFDLNELVSVTDQKLGNIYISDIYEATSDLGTVEGYVYYGYTFGAYDNGVTMINFMLGIDKDGNYTGFRFLSTDDTSLVISEIWTADYDKFDEAGYFTDGLEGQAANSTISLDLVAGLEVQITNIENAINEIGRFHTEDYSSRYNESVADTKLATAFDNAVKFESIYNNYDFVQGVVNVYEAYDNTDALLGYVYVGRYEGREDTISYVIGVGLDGKTEYVDVYETSETWNNATFENYDGSEGTDFATSSWLDLFEDIDAAAYVAGYTANNSTPETGTISLGDIDTVAGVTLTTGGDGEEHGFIDSVYVVLKFHVDNSVGGAS